MSLDFKPFGRVSVHVRADPTAEYRGPTSRSPEPSVLVEVEAHTVARLWAEQYGGPSGTLDLTCPATTFLTVDQAKALHAALGEAIVTAALAEQEAAA